MTLMSFTSLLAAAVTAAAATLAAGLAIFNSGFLVVTEAFDCTEAALSLASDKFFFVGVTVALVTFGAAARTAVGAVLALDFFAVAANAAFAGDVTAFTAVAAALPVGLGAVVFLVTDRVTGVDLLTGLVASLVFFAEGVGVFAVFFIAFAIESKPSESPHRANQTMYFMHCVSNSAKTRFARATFLNLSAPAFNFVHAIAYLL